MSQYDAKVVDWLDTGEHARVTTHVLQIADPLEREAVLEHLFVSDLTCPGATPDRGLALIGLGLHAWLSREAIRRIKDATSHVLSSSGLEAKLAKQCAAKLDERP